jgi:hypothetical protein
VSELAFAEWLTEQQLRLDDVGALARWLHVVDDDGAAEVRALSDLRELAAELGATDELGEKLLATWRAYERDRAPRPPERRSAPTLVRTDDHDVVDATPGEEREAARVARKFDRGAAG